MYGSYSRVDLWKTERYNSIGLDSLTNCKKKRNIVQLYHLILLHLFGGAEKIHLYRFNPKVYQLNPFRQIGGEKFK